MSIGRVFCLLCLVLLITLAWASWLFRYDIQTVANHDGYAIAYRLDRWNGNLWLIDNDQWYPVVEGNPDDFQKPLGTPKGSNL